MNRTATAPAPRPYCKTCATFGAAECTALRTGLNREVIADIHKPRCARHRLIPQHVARHPRAGVGGQLAVPRLEPASRYVADTDQPEGVGDLGRLPVQEMFPRVGNLGVDRLDAARLVGALRSGEVSLALGKRPAVLNLGSTRSQPRSVSIARLNIAKSPMRRCGSNFGADGPVRSRGKWRVRVGVPRRSAIPGGSTCSCAALCSVHTPGC